MGLDDMAPNDLANLMTVGGTALYSLLMVIFKSRCTQISILWGLWKCDRTVPTGSERRGPVRGSGLVRPASRVSLWP